MAYRRLNLGYVSGAQLAARARASGLLAARTREGAWARGALKFPIEALTHALTHVRRGGHDRRPSAVTPAKSGST